MDDLASGNMKLVVVPEGDEEEAPPSMKETSKSIPVLMDGSTGVRRVEYLCLIDMLRIG